MLMRVRDLIERLSHFEDDVLVATKQYSHASDRVTLDFIDQHEIVGEVIFKDGEDKDVVILG